MGLPRATGLRNSRVNRLSRKARKLRRACGKKAKRFSNEYRSHSGERNNTANRDWGKAGSTFLRLSPQNYSDQISEPTDTLPNPREISNNCFDQLQNRPSQYNVSDFLWQWGQFLDHDITLTPISEPGENLTIPIPMGDKFFDPFFTGEQEMAFERSAYQMIDGVREQVNHITSFIDASNVYGSDRERAEALRTFDGTGRLKVSIGDYLPLNTAGLPNARSGGEQILFLAGDERANEQIGLTALHTLFVREHNYWIRYLRAAMPRVSGDTLYQIARAIVSAEMQVITYQEFLPKLIGEGEIPAYSGYRKDVNPSISNEFASSAYRFGHTMLSSHLLRFDSDLEELSFGHLMLREAFFQPHRLVNEGGLEPVLRGLSHQPAQEIDMKLVDDVRNFLFGPPGSGGFDLASLNIQRNRDHGIANFNQVRRSLGLSQLTQLI